MLTLQHSLPAFTRGLEFIKSSHSRSSVVVCAQKGPRPRYPRVWKANKRIGTVSKSLKLVESIKGLSNVKEEVYGALDSFIAWELEFPLITVKKALKSLENQREWKRIIQVSKWMLSKGQGRTMGTYFTLLTALAEDGRIDEAEELWTKLFSQYLESMPRMFFDKMISIYYQHGLHDKMFEIFADMEELGVQPNVSIVTKVGNVFKEQGMLDKYNKLKKKYPPPKWEYRYIKGKRVKVRANYQNQSDGAAKVISEEKETVRSSEELLEAESNPDEQIVEAEEEDQNSNDLSEEAEASSDQLRVQS
ncbi:pentatricopeptide repeat-containing protein At4g21190 [Pyrus x bretschneideri]|uniref:pentatricopeptide repeat-containing protein At4g21190 n=1 Tax=Pyrus x bretschneideri TaxID=225117 RepID=UPI002030B675|nr:pentatricopeptide repeat-containing protein At4g21190 [Pyrus x bretschneideri]